ncbi:MAG: hypothetical protein KF696_02345 [Planctomycetes bacterium]|nr:hypothetical protein [Planctomycetota bacterium]MCW8134842.1 hypothetical protein [Planctomycetota bacterium]
MRTTCAALLLLVATVAIAQDKPKPNATTAIKPMELYRVAGRAWTYRLTEWNRGGSTRTGNERGSVTSSDGKLAAYKSSYTWEDGSGGGGSSGEVKLNDMDVEEKALADEALPEESLEMAGRGWVCRRHVTKEGDIEVTTWVSAEYHPLVIKQVKLGKDYCRIRKLTSFETGETDPWGLYRVDGRSWTVKSTTEIAGMDPMVSYVRYTVSKVTGKGATLTFDTLDKDKKAIEGIPASETEIVFELAQAAGGAKDEGPVMARERKKCEVGEFDCWAVEVAGMKSWTSVAFPGLLVCIESKSHKSELVEFDLGHDARRLYRKAGNYCVTSTTHTFAGMKVQNSMRIDVVSADKGRARYTTTSYDEAGNEQFKNESSIKVSEPTSPRMRYTNQVEETISTPAGTFRCVVADTGNGMKSWMWHGIVIRSVMETKDITMLQEVTELKVE